MALRGSAIQAKAGGFVCGRLRMVRSVASVVPSLSPNTRTWTRIYRSNHGPSSPTLLNLLLLLPFLLRRHLFRGANIHVPFLVAVAVAVVLVGLLFLFLVVAAAAAAAAVESFRRSRDGGK